MLLEEAAALPAEAEMQRHGQQQDVGKRDRLRERRQPIVEALARRIARPPLLLRRKLRPEQPVSIDLLDRGLD